MLMTSRERLLTTLNHREPDRVPYDLAGTHVSGIHVVAYKNLCAYLGINPEPLRFADVIQQVVVPKQDILDRFEVDTRGLFPLCSHNWNVSGTDVGEYYEYIDEWGFTQHLPKDNGLWWSLVKSPLDGLTVDPSSIENYPWPVANERRRIAGLRALAERYRAEDKVVMIKGLCAGLFEMGQRVRGMENFLCDLLADKQTAGILLDKLLDLKKSFWTMALDELGDVVDIVIESDDYGTQQSQLISYDTYRELIAPRLRELIQHIKQLLSERKSADENGYVFFHSCGNIRPFLPDFIDMGIDIINPVHLNAAGMEPEQLKGEFGGRITFWGGGIETQHILPNGTPEQIKADVKKNIAALKSGGGYVFNTVHNIQAEVPPQNIVAMWEALMQYGTY